jgi:aminocarboxymuconate-semialdehyde decarboxylase
MSTLDAAGTIDVHTHVVPPQTPFLDRLVRRDPRWARLERRADDATLADVVVAGRNFRTVRRVAYDLDVRRDEQSALGIAGQVLSAMPELFAPWSPAADATDYSRAFNEWLAAELLRHDGYFRGLGVVPLQDPAASAAMLHEVSTLGLLGIEIPSSTADAPLHDGRFDEFFGEAERLGLLVFVHSVGAADGFAHPMAGNGAIFPSRIGEAIAGLIGNGVIARHPRLQVLASHGGGSLPASVARLEFIRSMSPAVLEYMPQPAASYARQIWYDPLLFDAALVALLIDLVGADRVVLGSDYPFLPGDPTAVVHDPSLPAGFAARARSVNPHTMLRTLAGVDHVATQNSGGTS